MRDVGVIDEELRLLTVVRAAMKEDGTRVGQEVVDRLLDERLAVTAR